MPYDDRSRVFLICIDEEISISPDGRGHWVASSCCRLNHQRTDFRSGIRYTPEEALLSLREMIVSHNKVSHADS